MKYYSENDIVKQGWANYAQLSRASARPINVRLCRECPNFEPDGLQFKEGVIKGWCRRMSFLDTIEGEFPHYVDVYDTSFCNENDIVEEE